MEKRPLGRSSPSNGLRLFSTLLILHGLTSGVSSNHVMVPEQVTAVLRKNITLPCKIEVGSNLSLTQSSWERRLPSGKITLAVFNPEYGISISPEHAKRISFVSPSVRDATITLEGVDFADAGSYTCKVATFPLGNAQASTNVNVIVEPKVFVSAGSAALLHGGNESRVATCIAEQGRPAAEVFWETELMGRIERQVVDEANGTSTVRAHYMWQPQSLAHGKTLTCVVRHPALRAESRIPYTLNVQFAPVVSVMGIHRHWYVGQSNVKLICGAKANPPARHFAWVRLDGLMSEGVEVTNNTLSFTRPLDRNDSAAYRCEVTNDISVSHKDVYIWVQDPLPTTAAPVTTVPLPHDATTRSASDEQKAPFASPTLASLADGSLATIIGGVVGGILFLVLLLILGGVCFMRKRRTFRGDYYIKQYLGPSDMQKESQLDVLQPHELQEVYGDKTSKGSQELKPKLGGDIIYPDYSPEHKERDNWADRGENHRGLSEGDYCYQDHYNAQNMHPCGPPVHSTIVNNGSPYLPEDCYDNGTDSDYVSHMDGSVISRREWYV